MTPDELSERLLVFGAKVGRLVDIIPDTRLGRHIAGQLVRSATAASPNYEEARAAESRANFIHKLSICMKELRESRVWIRMLFTAELMPEERLHLVFDECQQLCNIIGQSLNTARQTKR